MWAENSVFYQIYPLGLCGAPRVNDGVPAHRISRVESWLDHIVRLGADAIYFSPIFESDTHGYDTRDFRTIDCRLGTNEDFAALCRRCHEKGIRVVLDAVFNHVGRNFWAFRDVREKKWDSPYRDWFHISFDGNTAYNDGFWYEAWEGHYELVKLNLRNPEVTGYLLDCVRFWVEQFDIDGLRLDVAYCLDRDFLRQLRSFTDHLKPDFFLVGETLHGDYNQWEFGPEYWTLYKGKHLLSFVDNHDVTRVASILNNPAHLPLIYGLLFGMPGIPCLYYGSEWGAEGCKQAGSDDNLRPAFDRPQWNDLTDRIAAMARAHRESPALCRGDFQDLVLTNRQTVFQRCADGDRVLVAVRWRPGAGGGER